MASRWNSPYFWCHINLINWGQSVFSYTLRGCDVEYRLKMSLKELSFRFNFFNCNANNDTCFFFISVQINDISTSSFVLVFAILCTFVPGGNRVIFFTIVTPQFLLPWYDGLHSIVTHYFVKRKPLHGNWNPSFSVMLSPVERLASIRVSLWHLIRWWLMEIVILFTWMYHSQVLIL